MGLGYVLLECPPPPLTPLGRRRAGERPRRPGGARGSQDCRHGRLWAGTSLGLPRLRRGDCPRRAGSSGVDPVSVRVRRDVRRRSQSRAGTGVAEARGREWGSGQAVARDGAEELRLWLRRCRRSLHRVSAPFSKAGAGVDRYRGGGVAGAGIYRVGEGEARATEGRIPAPTP